MVFPQVLADAVSGLIAIHDGHWTVHEDEAVLLAWWFHADMRCFDHVKGRLAVESLVYDLLDTSKAHLAQLGR